jgi:hypothetical protein
MWKHFKILLPIVVLRTTLAFNIMGRATRSTACGISSDSKEVPAAAKKSIAKRKVQPVKTRVAKEQTVAPATKVAAASKKSSVITIEACKQ